MPTAITQAPFDALLGAFGAILPVFRTAEASRWRHGEVRRALIVHRPVQRVFPFFARYTDWPRFMRHLYQVEDLGFGLSRWKAAGPAGLPVRWFSRVTRHIPNELIAWQSECGSTVPITGSIRFEPLDHDTRVHVRLSYQLPGGRLGRFVVWLFAIDLESALDEGLVRAREWIEAEQPANETRAEG